MEPTQCWPFLQREHFNRPRHTETTATIKSSVNPECVGGKHAFRFPTSCLHKSDPFFQAVLLLDKYVSVPRQKKIGCLWILHKFRNGKTMWRQEEVNCNMGNNCFHLPGAVCYDKRLKWRLLSGSALCMCVYLPPKCKAALSCQHSLPVCMTGLWQLLSESHSTLQFDIQQLWF